MKYPKQIVTNNDTDRVPIEFLIKKFFTGKPESLCYSTNREDLFLKGSSEVRRSIQLSYKRIGL